MRVMPDLARIARLAILPVWWVYQRSCDHARRWEAPWIGYLRTRGIADGGGPYVLTWLILPYWLIAAAFLPPSLLTIRTISRSRRLSKRRAAGL